MKRKNSIPLTHMPRRKKVKNRRAKSPYTHVKAKELESEEQKIKTHVPPKKKKRKKGKKRTKKEKKNHGLKYQ